VSVHQNPLVGNIKKQVAGRYVEMVTFTVGFSSHEANIKLILNGSDDGVQHTELLGFGIFSIVW
jgi:hypothetical protein